MNTLSIITVATLLSITALLCFGQEKSRSREEEYALLKRPEFIRVELARRLPELNEDPSDVNKPFTKDGKIYFRLIMTNTSPEPINIMLGNRYYQNRLELSKDGQIVPYRPDIAKLVEAVAFEGRRLRFLQLKPGESTDVDIIDLSDWYEPLTLGKYQLRNRYRFIAGGDWVETPVVMFEVDEGPVIYNEKTNRIGRLNQAQRKAFNIAFDALLKDDRIPEKQLEAYDIELKEDAETFIVDFQSRSSRRFFETKNCEGFKDHTRVVGWNAYYRLKKSDYSFVVTIFGPPC